MNSRERELLLSKQEENPKQCKATATPSSSRSQWSSNKNPRIVPVSRGFGGKDRHSKVCTVRGLRDRRIRLSVPTAIQLYDLQEKLGIGQPSKVVDWLLDTTKDDIDKLPPLPIIPLRIPQSSNPHHNHQGFLQTHSYFHNYYNPYLHWDLSSLPTHQQDSNSQLYFPSMENLGR